MTEPSSTAPRTMTLKTAVLGSTFLAMATSVGLAADIIYRSSPQLVGTAPSTPSLGASILAPTAALAYGAPWSVLLSPTGGHPPYRASVEGATLPGNVTLTETSGTFTIDGRAPQGTYGPYTVRLVDSAGTETNLTVPAIEVLPSNPELSVATGAASYRFAKDTPWSVRYVGNGGLPPYEFSVPEGFSGEADPSGQFIDIVGAGPPRVLSIPPISMRDALGTSSRASSPVEVRVGNDANLVATRLRNGGTTQTSTVSAWIRIVNNGDMPSNGPVTASATNGFGIESTTCTAPLQATQSCEMHFTYRPANPAAQYDGIHPGEVSFASGLGLAPIAIQSTVSGFDTRLAATPNRLDSVDVDDGTARGPWNTITVRNTGVRPTGPITVSHSNPGSFSLGTGTCVSGQTNLAGGQSCTVEIARRSENVGEQTSVVSVSSTSGTSLNVNATGYILWNNAPSWNVTPRHSNTITVKRAQGHTLTQTASGQYGAPYRWTITKVDGSPAPGTTSISANGSTMTHVLPTGLPVGSLRLQVTVYDRLSSGFGYPINFNVQE